MQFRLPKNRRNLALGLALPALTIWGQLAGSLFSEDFSTREYYPDRPQLRMRLSGKRAQPAGPGRYLIQQLRLETFYEDGQPEITIEAPECLYDMTLRTASSPGRLKIQGGGGLFLLTGEGFLWQQTGTSLIISNRVRTEVSELPKPAAKP